MKIGFTGTQRGLTIEQEERLRLRLIELWATFTTSEFHHGDCIGADATAARFAYASGFCVFVHPPTKTNKRAWTKYHNSFLPKPYLARNHDIVDACELLIACPGERTEQLRSGTWATVRYARKKKVPVELILP